MRAFDLMVGDWVYNKNTDSYIQVYPMMISQMFRQTPDAQAEDYNIFPIPLTKEILIQTGFEIQDQGGGWFDVWTGFGEDNEKDIEVEFRDDGRIYVKIDGYGDYFTSSNIKYVHQLQHILNLLEINIKIILEEKR